MSQVKVSSIVDTSGGNTATINGYTPTLSNMAGRNRIINGDMRIDQRNAGASGTAVNTYTVDRFAYVATVASKGTWGQSTTAPAGYTNSLSFTSSSAYSVLSGDYFHFLQPIEGFNVADFGWGTANAQTATLSFWVRSSLTGTFGGTVQNSASNRSYPFSYTVNSANTWEQKTITIPGDTTGTWLTNNGIGIMLRFSLGTGTTKSGTANTWAAADYYAPTGATSVVGTSGATFQITGVQLEAGSVATPFERRDYGRELMMCQRYYYRQTGSDYSFMAWGKAQTTGNIQAIFQLPVTMRIKPALEFSTVGGFMVETGSTVVASLTSFTLDALLTTPQCIGMNITKSSSFTTGAMYWLVAFNNSSAFLAGSAEL